MAVTVPATSNPKISVARAGVVAALGGAFSVCAFDLPGHGASPVTAGPVSISGLAVALAETMRAKGLGPAIVVGCSLGGMVAQALAVEAPELVRGLVLANTNDTQTEAGCDAMRDRAELARLGIAQIRAVLLAADSQAHANCWDAIGDLDPAADITGITAPALIVAGGDERSIPLEKSQALAGLLPYGVHSIVRDAVAGPGEQRFTGRVAYRTTFPASLMNGQTIEGSTKWMAEDRHIVIYYLNEAHDGIYFVTSTPEPAYDVESWSTKGDMFATR